MRQNWRPHDEPLRDVDVEQGDDDVDDRQDEEDTDRHPEPVDARVGDRRFVGGDSLQGDLKRGEHVIGVEADQDADAHRDDREHQQQRQHRPDHHALPAGEIPAGDTPELTTPLRQPRDQEEHQQQARRGDQERDRDPQKGVDELVAPVDRRPERAGVHADANVEERWAASSSMSTEDEANAR